MDASLPRRIGSNWAAPSSTRCWSVNSYHWEGSRRAIHVLMSQAKVLPFSRLSRVGARTLRHAPLHHVASAPKKK